MQRTSSVLQALRCAWSAQLQTGQAASYRWATQARTAGAVPDGHLTSDLSDTACHIGLGRRRDLCLRQDLGLWQAGNKVGLSDLLRGKKVIIVGFPGGRICTEKHIPGYVEMAEVMSAKGVDKVFAVTVDEPSNVQDLASKQNLGSSKVELLADKNGGFMRLLGLELAPPDAGAGEIKCQRFAAIVEDGILLKLKVEQSPAELKVSDAASMAKLWDCVYV